IPGGAREGTRILRLRVHSAAGRSSAQRRSFSESSQIFAELLLSTTTIAERPFSEPEETKHRPAAFVVPVFIPSQYGTRLSNLLVFSSVFTRPSLWRKVMTLVDVIARIVGLCHAARAAIAISLAVEN